MRADNPCYNTTCIDIPANETDSAELYRCAAGDCPLGFNKTENAMVDECFGEGLENMWLLIAALLTIKEIF